MVARLYTKTALDALISMPKRVDNPRARWLKKPKPRPAHRQRNSQASGEGAEDSRFLIHQRQSPVDDFDFSCGIIYLPRGGSQLTLAGYNEPSHEHGDIAYRPLMHQASESAIAAGNRFECPEGALACLSDDYDVSGLVASHDQQGLSE